MTTAEQELLQRYLAQSLDQMQSANRQVVEGAKRLRIHNAQEQGRGFLELVTSEQDNGTSYIEAVYKVASEHPDLYEEYRLGVGGGA